MSKKGQLFRLIKSLTKAEKRYFRLYARQAGDTKNYMELFEFLDTSELPDELALKENFAGRAFIRQLHVTKNYLTQLILKSLRNFHSAKSIRTELAEAVINIEILYRKALYDQCNSLIGKAMKMAEKYEYFHVLLEILSWKRRLLTADYGPIKSGPLIIKVLRMEAEVVQKLNNYNQYLSLSYEMLAHDLSSQKVICRMKEHPLLAHPQKAASFSAQVLYYHSWYALHTVAGNIGDGQAILSHLIHMFEENPHRIKENPDGYITALNNKMAMLLRTRDIDGAVATLKKIRKIPVNYQIKEDSYTLKIFMKTYNAELELYRDTKDWKNCQVLIREIQSFIENHVKHIANGYLISFYYQFAYVHFMCTEYSRSLAVLNKIMNTHLEDERLDIQTYARFLLLMIHYELGNIMVLRYSVDSTRRFLKKNKRKLQHFELTLLKFFSKLSVSPPGNYVDLFKKLKKELFTKLNARQQNQVLDYLDFNSWIETKIT